MTTQLADLAGGSTASLDLDFDTLLDMGYAAVDLMAALHTQPSPSPFPDHHDMPTAAPAISDEPGDFHAALTQITQAAAAGNNTLSPYDFAHVPSGGLPVSAIGEFLARAVNPYTGVHTESPELVRWEQRVNRWLCERFGLPTGSGALITTGASVGALHAMVAARHDRLRERHLAKAVVYVTEATHHTIGRAARIAGVRAQNVRLLPMTAELRLDVEAARWHILRDRLTGQRPMMIVATAGSTDTGTVDDLPAVAALAARFGLWLHVDAAYGGGYVLTDRGRDRLTGIGLADSITFDPHKAWSLPFGTSVLLVRDVATLRRAFEATGHYLDQSPVDPETPNFSCLGMELTREFRALRLWLPLHVHGLRAFTAHLDDKLALAQLAYRDLRADPTFELPWAPDLGVVTFHLRRGDEQDHLRLLALLDQRGVALSPTTIRGRAALRMCICSHRTHTEHVRHALQVIRAAAHEFHGPASEVA